MVIQLLNELIPLMKIIAIGVVTNSVIEKLQILLSAIPSGKYNLTISFSKVGK